MKSFEYNNPTKLIFGKDAMEKIRENIAPYGKKVLLVYGGGSIKKNGIYDMVKKQLRVFTVREFSGIEPNPRVETIRECVKKYKSFDPDIILAVGGGSVIDGSKLIASALHYEGDAWDFLTDWNTSSKKYISLATVLTLAATGSESNSGSVITRWETNEKRYFVKDEIYPKFSILDPQNTYTVPKDQTAYGIVDAYSHVLEQYIHVVEDTPLQDRISESILLTLIENAPIVLKKPRNYTARANIMFSATMALNNLISLGTGEDWATHMIEHEISAFYDIPHAAGLAIITPRWMKEVLIQKRKKIAQYGRRIWNLKGNDNSVSQKAIDKTYAFFKSLGVKMSLSDWNVNEEHFDTITDRLNKAKVGEKPLSKSQIKQILNNSLK